MPSNLQLAGEVERVPGGKGRAVKLQEGQYLKVTNTHGEQVRADTGAQSLNTPFGSRKRVLHGRCALHTAA